MLEQLTIHRRALHRIPELDDQLPETQAYLLDRLSPALPDHYAGPLCRVGLF